MIKYEGTKRLNGLDYLVMSNDNNLKVFIPIEPGILDRIVKYISKISTSPPKSVEHQNAEAND